MGMFVPRLLMSMNHGWFALRRNSIVFTMSSVSAPSLHSLSPSGQLREEQLRSFFHQGFLRLDEVVPSHLVRQALGRINESLGKVGQSGWDSSNHGDIERQAMA